MGVLKTLFSKHLLWGLVTLLLLFWGIGLGLEWGLNRFLPVEQWRRDIVAGVYEASEIRAEVNTLHLRPTLFQGVVAQLRGVSLTSPHQQYLGAVQRIDIAVRYWPFLTDRRLSVSAVDLHGLRASFSPQSDWLRITLKARPEGNVRLEDTSFALDGATVRVSGLTRLKAPADVVIRQLRLTHWEGTQPAKLKIKGRVLVDNAVPAPWKLDAVFGRLGKATVLDYLRRVRQARLHVDQLESSWLNDMLPPSTTLSGFVGRLERLALSVEQDPQGPMTLRLNVKHSRPLRFKNASHRQYLPGSVVALSAQVSPRWALPLAQWDIPRFTFDWQAKGQSLRAQGSWRHAYPWLNGGGTLTLNSRHLDMQMIRAWLPPSTLQAYPLLAGLKGRLSSNLRLSGPLKSPAVTGRLTLAKGQWQGIKHLRLDIERTGLVQGRLYRLSGHVNHQPFRVSGDVDGLRRRGSLRWQANQVSVAVLQSALMAALPAQSTLLNLPWRVQGQWSGRGEATYQPSGLTGRGVLDLRDFRLMQSRDTVMQAQSLHLGFVPGLLRLETSGLNVLDATSQLHLTWASRAKYPDIDFKAAQLSLDKLKSTLSPYLVKQYPDLARLELSGRSDLQVSGALNKLDGQALLNQVAFTLSPIAGSSTQPLHVTRLNGKIRLAGPQITLENLMGLLADNVPVRLTGVFDRVRRTYRGELQAEGRPEEWVKALGKVAPPTMGSGSFSAAPAKLRLVASGQWGQVPQIKASLLMAPSRQSPGLSASLDFTSPSAYRANIDAKRVPLVWIRDNRPWLSAVTGVSLPELYNVEGDADLQLLVTPAQKRIQVSFNQVGLSMAALPYPVHQLNGRLVVEHDVRWQVAAENIRFRYANSPMRFDFDLSDLNDVYLETSGTLSPLLVNDWFLANNSATVAYAAVPYEINLSGNLGRGLGYGKHNDLQLFFNVNPASLFERPQLERPEDAHDASLANTTLSSVLHLVGDTLTIEETRFKAGENSGIRVMGTIEKLFNHDERKTVLQLETEPTLDLRAFINELKQPDASGWGGHIVSALKLEGLGPDWGLFGRLAFDRVKSERLSIEDLNGHVDFEGLKALWNIDHFQIPGVNIAFTAQNPDLGVLPLPFTDFTLTGSQFIVPLYSEWLGNVVGAKLRQGIWERFFPNTGRIRPLPFEIDSGTVDLAEGILNNLIVENFKSKLKLYPNTYFELDDASAQTAGGDVRGHFAMNPRSDNFMSVHMDIHNMKANALTQILLNVSNQIFGDVSGIIDFTTEGLDIPQLLANTNGSANLGVERGRLPEITKMENLLVAANTISGGLTNLNLNSLFRIASPFKTDYFAKLTGDFKMVSGVIYTDNMLSDGNNLDLLIKGQIRMTDGVGLLTVKGNTNREVGGLLGAFGDLSLGRFLGILPPLRILISHIPGLGFIPGFGGPKTKDGVAFQVTIDGPVVDPGSIKDFKWLN